MTVLIASFQLIPLRPAIHTNQKSAETVNSFFDARFELLRDCQK